MDKSNEILNFAIEVGKAMLECGAEIHRADDAITRICKHYGAEEVEVLTIASSINASIRINDNIITHIKRVDFPVNNMFKLENLNTLSRKICKEDIDINDAYKLLEETKNKKSYGYFVNLVGTIIAVFGFSLFFGGNVTDGITAGLLSVPIFILSNIKSKITANHLVRLLSLSFVSGALTSLAYRIVPIQIDKVLIGIIMILIPGVTFFNSIRDILMGDVISGLLRICQSLLLAVAIASGIALSLFIFGGVL